MTVIACIAAGRRSAPGGVIYRNEHWMVDHAVIRLLRGYLILKPVRHVHEIADLATERIRPA